MLSSNYDVEDDKIGDYEVDDYDVEDDEVGDDEDEDNEVDDDEVNLPTVVQVVGRQLFYEPRPASQSQYQFNSKSYIRSSHIEFEYFSLSTYITYHLV